MHKVSEEQLNSAREIRAKQQQIQMELGALHVSSEDIKIRQESLVSELRSTGDDIQELMKSLEDVFGAGTLNLETGEFSPSEEQ